MSLQAKGHVHAAVLPKSIDRSKQQACMQARIVAQSSTLCLGQIADGACSMGPSAGFYVHLAANIVEIHHRAARAAGRYETAPWMYHTETALQASGVAPPMRYAALHLEILLSV